jgi:hypothetical protein
MNTLSPYTQLPYNRQEQLLLDAGSGRTAYFTKIPWQYFTTHFITRPSANNHRRELWHEYIDRVRMLHRDTLAYLWSEESRTAHGDLYQLPVHFHALWFSNRQLDTHMMATEWSALAGTGGKPIDIQPYSSAGDGLAYVLKLADRDDCHWDFSNNLSLFFPESVDLSTAQGRRRYRRHLARASSPLTTASDSVADTLRVGGLTDSPMCPEPSIGSPCGPFLNAVCGPRHVCFWFADHPTAEPTSEPYCVFFAGHHALIGSRL